MVGGIARVSPKGVFVPACLVLPRCEPTSFGVIDLCHFDLLKSGREKPGPINIKKFGRTPPLLDRSHPFLERCKGHTHKGHREKVLNVMNFRIFQGVFGVFSGSFRFRIFQGVFRVFFPMPFPGMLFGPFQPSTCGICPVDKSRLSRGHSVQSMWKYT